MRRAELDPDPLRQFAAWFAEAERRGVPFPESVALASADAQGRPSARMLLLKGADERGFVVFTHYASRKGRELEENPHAALLFYWQALGRQVRVEGRVERVPAAESDAYFATRSRGSQLGAWASRQSEPLTGRDELEQALEAARERFAGGPVARPEGWGGLRVVPDALEFWEHGDDRLHDRFRYTRADAGWRLERLAP